jgi:hypothetical protein
VSLTYTQIAVLGDFACKSLLRRSTPWLQGLVMIGSTPAMPAQESSGFGASTPRRSGPGVAGFADACSGSSASGFSSRPPNQGHAHLKGGFSTGYVILMDQAGEKVNLKPTGLPAMQGQYRHPQTLPDD